MSINIDGWDARRLDQLARDVRDQSVDITTIKNTLIAMQTDELQRLRERAEAPKRWLYAILTPVLASVITAALLSAHAF